MSTKPNNIVAAGGKQKTNRVIAFVCLSFFVGMIGVAYAAVPLYKLFCQVTGYAGTPQRAEQVYAGKVLDKDITIRFDANANGITWDFAPAARSVTLKIGETGLAHYKATNLASAPVTGRATFNVVPDVAGAYFNKVECFCFTDQTLQPGETMDMPVVFYVDPDIVNAPELKNIKTITLSYTMFPVEGTKPVASRPGPGKSKANTEGTLGG